MNSRMSCSSSTTSMVGVLPVMMLQKNGANVKVVLPKVHAALNAKLTESEGGSLLLFAGRRCEELLHLGFQLRAAQTFGSDIAIAVKHHREWNTTDFI